MRVGLALSSIVHLGVLLVAFLAFASPRLFDPTPTETVAVDIVSEEELAAKSETPRPEPLKIDLPKPEAAKSEAAKPDTAKPESAQPEAAKPDAPQPDGGKEQKADDSREPERQERAAPAEAKTRTAAKPDTKSETKPDTTSPPSAQGPGSQPASRTGNPASTNQQMAADAGAPPPDPFAPDATPQPVYFPMFKNLGSWAADYEFDAMAERSAGLAPADIAAFRAHLDKCWKPPAAMAGAQNLKAVVRIALTPEGAMAAEPILIGASASAQGPALVDTARRALTACQPFDFLPADKYSEWKILELNFTPKGLGG
jgi:outer membrane biosynthesis protein TonB